MIFEIILVALFFLGYMFFEGEHINGEGNVCGDNTILDDFGQINFTNNISEGKVVLSDKKEDLNS